MSDNLALEDCSTKNGSFAFFREKASSMRQADLRDIFKKTFKSICISAGVVSPDPLSPALSNFFSYKDSRKDRRGP